jgi:hypothetical protein
MTPVTHKIFVVSFLSLAGLLAGTKVNAQDAGVGTLPMMYNGGFAGEAGTSRLASFSSFRRSIFVQRSTLSTGRAKDYGTFLSYDFFLKKIRSGIGVTASHYYSDDNYIRDFKNTSVALAISPKFSYNGKFTVAPFADFTFIHSTASDYREVSVSPPYEFKTTNYRGIARAGLLVNSDHAYIGLSMEVWQFKGTEEPTFRFDQPQGVFVRSFNAYLQAGYTFQRNPESKFSFTPQLVIGHHRNNGDNYTSIRDVSLCFRYQKLIWGGSRNGFMVGYQDKRLKLQANYIPNNSAAISLRYTLKKTKAENPKFTLHEF